MNAEGRDGTGTKRVRKRNITHIVAYLPLNVSAHQQVLILENDHLGKYKLHLLFYLLFIIY